MLGGFGGDGVSPEIVKPPGVSSCAVSPSGGPLGSKKSLMLAFNGKPVLCGGEDNNSEASQDCYIWDSTGAWADLGVSQQMSAGQVANSAMVQFSPTRFMIAGNILTFI